MLGMLCFDGFFFHGFLGLLLFFFYVCHFIVCFCFGVFLFGAPYNLLFGVFSFVSAFFFMPFLLSSFFNWLFGSPCVGLSESDFLSFFSKDLLKDFLSTFFR